MAGSNGAIKPPRPNNWRSGYVWPSGGRLPFYNTSGAYYSIAMRKPPQNLISGTMRYQFYTPTYVDDKKRNR